MISRRRRSNNVANGVSTKKRDVNDLLNSLDLYGTVQLPAAEVVSISGGSQGVDMLGRPVQIPASGPDLDILLSGQQRLLEELYPKGWMGETDEEYDARRRQQLDFTRRQYMGELTPDEVYMSDYYRQYGGLTASGTATPVYPMTYVSPSGDLEAILSSIGQMAEGDYVSGLLNGGLALGAIFLPGSVQVGSSKAGGVFEKVLDKQGQISKNNVLAIAGKEGVNKGEAAVLNKVASRMGDKMDYMEFKQAVSDELSFEIGKTDKFADFGVKNVYSPLNEMKTAPVIKDIQKYLISDNVSPDHEFFASNLGAGELRRSVYDFLLLEGRNKKTYEALNSGDLQELRSVLDKYNSRIDGIIDNSSHALKIGNLGDESPFVNVFDAVDKSTRPISFGSSVNGSFLSTILVRDYNLNIDSIISDPEKALTRVNQSLADIKNAHLDVMSSAQEASRYFLNAMNIDFLAEANKVKTSIIKYMSGDITENQLRDALLEYPSEPLNIDQYDLIKDIAIKKVAKKMIASNNDRLEDPRRVVEYLSNEFPEFKIALDDDLSDSDKFFDRVKSKTSLMTSPSGNFPTSKRHFPEAPSAHIRSFESPTMGDALFISEMQSDALQKYKPNSEALVNRMRVDKTLIDKNTAEYLKRMLSTEGYGYDEFGSQEYPSHVYAIMNHLYELGEGRFIENERKIRNILNTLDTDEKVADFVGMDVEDVEYLELQEVVNDILRSINGASYDFLNSKSLDSIIDRYKVFDDSFVKSVQKSQYKRLVQESTKIAADKGKKKVYFPAGETVSKIEGWEGNLSEETRKNMMRPYDNLNKDIKKALGVNPNKVTIQGNEWWEVDIPESYLSGTHEIIAFGLGGKMRVKKKVC